MSQAEDQAGFFYDSGQGYGIFYRGGQRLVADYVDACFEEGFRWREVEMIGSHDRDCVYAVFAFRFGCGHFCEGGVGAVWGDVQVLGGFAGFFWVGGEGCGC